MGTLFETDGGGKRVLPRHVTDDNFAEYIQSLLAEPYSWSDLEAMSQSRLRNLTPELKPKRRPRPPADLPPPKDNVVILSHANARKRRVRLQDATIIPFDAHWRVPDQLRQALTAVTNRTDDF